MTLIEIGVKATRRLVDEPHPQSAPEDRLWSDWLSEAIRKEITQLSGFSSDN